MIRLEIIEKKDLNNETVIANPLPGGLMLAEFYKEKLAEAALEKKEVLSFASIPFVEKNSENFQNIYFLEKSIMTFFKTNEYPKKIRIVCDDVHVSELYKVVYNFYYPGAKSERLEDDKWD